MAINVIIRVLTSVSGEAQLSSGPPMYPDKTPSAIKGEKPAPPESSAFKGVHLRKQKGCGVRLLPMCIPGLNTKSKAVGLLYDFQ